MVGKWLALTDMKYWVFEVRVENTEHFNYGIMTFCVEAPKLSTAYFTALNYLDDNNFLEFTRRIYVKSAFSTPPLFDKIINS